MNTRTAPLPPVDPTDPIWTVEHVAAVLRLGPRTTRTDAQHRRVTFLRQ